jgi:hypothetical protein
LISIGLQSNRYFREPSVAWRRIADEVVLVPVRGKVGCGDAIYVLSEVAARTWELVDGGQSISSLAEAIAEEFEVEADEAETDLAELLENLERVGVVAKVAP